MRLGRRAAAVAGFGLVVAVAAGGAFARGPAPAPRAAVRSAPAPAAPVNRPAPPRTPADMAAALAGDRAAVAAWERGQRALACATRATCARVTVELHGRLLSVDEVGTGIAQAAVAWRIEHKAAAFALDDPEVLLRGLAHAAFLAESRTAMVPLLTDPAVVRAARELTRQQRAAYARSSAADRAWLVAQANGRRVVDPRSPEAEGMYRRQVALATWTGRTVGDAEGKLDPVRARPWLAARLAAARAVVIGVAVPEGRGLGDYLEATP